MCLMIQLQYVEHIVRHLLDVQDDHRQQLIVDVDNEQAVHEAHSVGCVYQEVRVAQALKRCSEAVYSDQQVVVEVLARNSYLLVTAEPEFRRELKLDYSLNIRLGLAAPPRRHHHPSDDGFQSNPWHYQYRREARNQHMPKGLYHLVIDRILHRCITRHGV